MFEWINNINVFIAGFGTGLFARTLTTVVWLLLAFFLLFVMYRLLSADKVVIWKRTGSGIQLQTVSGRIVKRKGHSRYKIHRLRREENVPPPESILTEKKIFGLRNWVFFQEDGNNLIPTKPTLNSPLEFSAVDNLAALWQDNIVREKRERYHKPSLLEKYGALIAFGFVVSICFILIIITLNYVQQISSDASSHLGQFISAAKPLVAGGGGVAP